MFCVVLICCMLWCYKNVCLFYVIRIFVAWKVIDRVWYSEVGRVWYSEVVC